MTNYILNNKKFKINLDGWKRQSVDERDYSFKSIQSTTRKLPFLVDNRNICSPIQNQGRLGSCTAHMFAAMIESNQIKNLQKSNASFSFHEENELSLYQDGFFYSLYCLIKYHALYLYYKLSGFFGFLEDKNNQALTSSKVLVRPSRLFHYYVTRKIRGTIDRDSGASIRESIKAGNLFGSTAESNWIYNILNFKKSPPKKAWDNANLHKVNAYYSISDGDLKTMKRALADGYLVGFGFAVFKNLMSEVVSITGLLTRPKSSDTCIGGHAVVLVGYDDNKEMPDGSKGAFLVRNSWGTSWGIEGYFWMSYNYVGDSRLSNDFWVIESSPI